MTHTEFLLKELGELQDRYSILDESEENKAIGKRIREIREELNLVCKPRKSRRPPKVINR